MQKNLSRLILKDNIEIQYYDKKYWLVYKEECSYNIYHQEYTAKVIHLSIPKKTFLYICYMALFPDLPNPIKPVSFSVRKYRYSDELLVDTYCRYKAIGQLTQSEKCDDCWDCNTKNNITNIDIRFTSNGVQFKYSGPTLGVEEMKKLFKFLHVKRYVRKVNV